MHQPRSDNELLRAFAEHRDENAFKQFVALRLNLVYSVALRVLNGDRHLAEDVSQQVFVDAARKAAKLSKHERLPAWLFTSARYAACRLARSRIRQSKREQTAATMTQIDSSPTEPQTTPPELQPMLDDAIETLPSRDQTAILLRFYAQLDYNAIGDQLNLTANAARMRVDRALRKLESILLKRGITSSALALSAALEGHALVSAPIGLSASLSASALNSLSTTSAIASATALSAAKWPLVATLAIVATGAYVQSSLPEPSEASASTAPLPLYSESSTQPQSTDPAETPEPALRKQASEPDAIERAYAALDRDAALLSQRLAEINTQMASSAGKTPNGTLIFQIRDLDKPPHPQSSQTPLYPTTLRGTHTPGEVVVEYTIDAAGAPRDAEVLGASHPEFAKSALEALPKWKFAPGEVASEAVAARVKQIIKFEPSDEEPDFDWWF